MLTLAEVYPIVLEVTALVAFAFLTLFVGTDWLLNFGSLLSGKERETRVYDIKILLALNSIVLVVFWVLWVYVVYLRDQNQILRAFG